MVTESKYWQHINPIECPKHHKMIWLGSVYWICEKCHIVYVQQKEKYDNR